MIRSKTRHSPPLDQTLPRAGPRLPPVFQPTANLIASRTLLTIDWMRRFGFEPMAKTCVTPPDLFEVELDGRGPMQVRANWAMDALRPLRGR